MHVLNLEVGQVAVLNRLAEHNAGVGGMHMAVGDVVILNDDDRIAVGLKEGAQLGDAGAGVLVDKELGAVAVLDVLDLHQVVGKNALARSVAVQLRLGGDFFALDHAAPVKDLLHALEHDQDALAARVHNTGLFQHRQQVRGILQRGLAGGHDLGPQGRDLGGGGGGGRFGRQAGDGQDGAFGRLHDRLVSGFHAHLQRFGQVGGLRFLLALQRLGEAAEQKARDDAGVAARAAQHGGGRHLAGLRDRAGIGQRFQLLGGRADGHAHVRARITVRYRENVQLIDAGALVGNVVGAGEDGVAQSLTVDHGS